MNFDQLVFYFFFYSFLGFILESIYRSIASRRLVYPGFLYGPYCPIYGFGLLAVFWLLSPLKQQLWLFIPGAFILTSVLEYITGYLLERLLGLRLWDYNKKFLNINGRVSLEFSIYWTVLSYLFIFMIHPFFLPISIYLETIGILWVMKFLIIPVMFVDFMFSVNKAIYTKRKITALELLLTQIDELKDNAGDRLESLKEDYTAMMDKLFKMNKSLFIYGISSKKFPKVMKKIREAGKNSKIVKWFKEDK